MGWWLIFRSLSGAMCLLLTRWKERESVGYGSFGNMLHTSKIQVFNMKLKSA
jgi:hypothetical protein